MSGATVAVMQPYFFPYVGYFQLLRACDVFVLYDDAQYMKGGWINRNRILVNGGPKWLVFPVVSASHVLPINRRSYVAGAQASERLLMQIHAAYRRAPHFRRIFSVVEEAFGFPDRNVAAFNGNLLRRLAGELRIHTRMTASSEIGTAPSIGGEARVIAICKALGAERYVNAIGGTALYDSTHFREQGLSLEFIEPAIREYPQFGGPHVGALSVIDALMFVGPDGVASMLDDFRPFHPGERGA